MNKTYTRIIALATTVLGLLAKEQSCKLTSAAAVPGNLEEKLLKAIKASEGSSLWQKQRLKVDEAVSELFKIIKAPLTRSSSNVLHHRSGGRIDTLFIHTAEKGAKGEKGLTKTFLLYSSPPLTSTYFDFKQPTRFSPLTGTQWMSQPEPGDKERRQDIRMTHAGTKQICPTRRELCEKTSEKVRSNNEEDVTM